MSLWNRGVRDEIKRRIGGVRGTTDADLATRDQQILAAVKDLISPLNPGPVFWVRPDNEVVLLEWDALFHRVEVYPPVDRPAAGQQPIPKEGT